MSIPTSEIPQERQDHARTLLDASAYGRMPGPIQDRLVRTLDRARDSAPTVEAYQILVNPNRALPNAPFSRLNEDELSKILDVVALRPVLRHSMWYPFVAEAILETSPPAAVRAKAIDVACLPLRSAEINDREDRLSARAYYLEDHQERLVTLDGALRANGFTSASSEDRVRVLEVLELVGGTGLIVFNMLLDQGRPADGWTRLRAGVADMFQRDLRDSTTLLDQLHRLVGGTIDSRVEIRPTHRAAGTHREGGRRVANQYGRWGRDENVTGQWVAFRQRSLVGDLANLGTLVDKAVVLDSLVAEVAMPSRHINQDNRGTCEATTFLHRLAQYCPPEYARLAVDLLLTGTSNLAHATDGRPFQPPEDAFPSDDSNRSVTERLTQSATMRYWRSGFSLRGRRAAERDDLYRNVRNERRDATNPTGGQRDGFLGRFNWRQDDRDGEAMVRAMFGIDHQIVRARPYVHGQNAQAMPSLRQALAASPGRPVFVAVEWGTGGHAFDVLEITDDPEHPRVVYWNPWGGAMIAYLDGVPITYGGAGWTGQVDTSGGPTRRTEDQDAGVQSMSMATFRRILKWVMVQR